MCNRILEASVNVDLIDPVNFMKGKYDPEKEIEKTKNIKSKIKPKKKYKRGKFKSHSSLSNAEICEIVKLSLDKVAIPTIASQFDISESTVKIIRKENNCQDQARLNREKITDKVRKQIFDLHTWSMSAPKIRKRLDNRVSASTIRTIIKEETEAILERFRKLSKKR